MYGFNLGSKGLSELNDLAARGPYQAYLVMHRPGPRNPVWQARWSLHRVMLVTVVTVV